MEDTETSKELGDNSGTENQNLENETQENVTNASPDDYLGDTGNDDDSKGADFTKELNVDYKQRYADSTREAQRIKSEHEKAQKELDELVTWINDDPEMSELAKTKLEGKTKTNVPDPKVEAILAKVASLESKLNKTEGDQNTDIIRKFESGKEITKETRQKMKVYVKPLVDSGISIGDALESAWVIVNKDNLEKLVESKVLGKQKENEAATYTTSNSAQKGTSKTVTLTTEEQRVFDKMPGTLEEKTAMLEFMKKK